MRELTDSERLDLAMELLNDYQLEEYSTNCELLEQSKD